MNLDNQIGVDTLAPEVLGSFSAQDVLGAADGSMGAGATIYASKPPRNAAASAAALHEFT
jgi:hypothetical protein